MKGLEQRGIQYGIEAEVNSVQAWELQDQKRSTFSSLRVLLIWWVSPREGFCSVAQSCLTLCSCCSVRGISQAGILEWLAFPSPGVFPIQGSTQVSYTAGGFFTICAPGKPNSTKQYQKVLQANFPIETELWVFTIICYLCCFYSSCLMTVVCSFVPLRRLLLRPALGASIVARLRSQSGLGLKWFLFCQIATSGSLTPGPPTLSNYKDWMLWELFLRAW